MGETFKVMCSLDDVITIEIHMQLSGQQKTGTVKVPIAIMAHTFSSTVGVPIIGADFFYEAKLHFSMENL